MKLIILAAGKGERLMPLTRNTPKPLLDMGTGMTLLEEQLSRIQESGVIDKVVLVTGYLADQIDAKLKTFHLDTIEIETSYNPFYAVSNNLMSLWLARSAMDGDFLVTNGDNLFAPCAFQTLCEGAGEGVSLLVSEKSTFDYDDMKVATADGQIVRVSKEIPDGEAAAESPGLALVRGDRARALVLEQLDGLARDPAKLNAYWLELFNRLYQRGVPVSPCYFDGSRHWQEMDVHQDVDILRRSLKIRMETGDKD